MKHRIWEIRREKFDLLLKRLPFTDKMREALQSRYDDDCAYARSLVAEVCNVSEYGLAKAEKILLDAHKEFEDVYGNRD